MDKEVFDELKKTNPDIIIAYHFYGSIRPIVTDMIEIRLNVLNPIQLKALDMDLANLKKTQGKDLAFFG